MINKGFKKMQEDFSTDNDDSKEESWKGLGALTGVTLRKAKFL